jgi:hypothetical protein
MNMKKFVIVPALLTLVLFVGCLSPTTSEETPHNKPTPSNEKPVAYIDNISHDEATLGTDISFQGHGTDTDGDVVAYRWASNIDGQLATTGSFSYSNLSLGEHEIAFKVQDNNGAWSEAAVSTIIIMPEPIFVDIIHFTIEPESIHLGDTATLSWEIIGAEEVTLEPDIGEVNLADSINISPESDTTYIITAIRGEEVESEEVEITVVAPDEYSKSLIAIPSESSSIFFGDPPLVWPPGAGISIGDYSTNVPVQGFASFDISDIPSDATITSVEVDFSNYTIGGTPFDDLGCLRLYPQGYGELDSDDFFTASPTGAVLKYCSEAAITPHDSNGMREAIQNAVGHNRFQVRFQFNELDTDHENDQDYIHWECDDLILNIYYESYE